MKKTIGWILFISGLLGTIFFGLVIIGDIWIKVKDILGKDVGESIMATFFWPIHVGFAVPSIISLIIGRKILRNKNT